MALNACAGREKGGDGRKLFFKKKFSLTIDQMSKIANFVALMEHAAYLTSVRLPKTYMVQKNMKMEQKFIASTNVAQIVHLQGECIVDTILAPINDTYSP